MDFPSDPGDFFESEYGKIHYRYSLIEDSQVICILPGFSIPSSIYTRFTKELNEMGFSVLIIDYFGRGFSEPSSSFDFSIESTTDAFLLLLNHLEITKCSFISVSYGSLITANIIEKNPSIINRLIFISPLMFQKSVMRPFQRFLLSNQYIGPFVLRGASNQFISTDIARQFSDISKHCDSYWAAVGASYQQSICNKYYLSSIAKSLSYFSESFNETEMQKATNVSIRTLVLLGGKDHLIKIPENEHWWNKWMPNVKVTIYPDYGHLMIIEEPEEIAETIVQFLQK